MANDPGPHDLRRTFAVLDDRADVTLMPSGPDFFARLGQAFPSFLGHVLISRFEFDSDWGVWEIHPHGDELVFLLSGAVDLALKTPDGERVVSLTEPGQYAVVPKNTHHTARTSVPTSMLFITPGHETRNEDLQ